MYVKLRNNLPQLNVLLRLAKTKPSPILMQDLYLLASQNTTIVISDRINHSFGKEFLKN